MRDFKLSRDEAELLIELLERPDTPVDDLSLGLLAALRAEFGMVPDEFYMKEVQATYEQIPKRLLRWFVAPQFMPLTWNEGVPPTIDPAPSPYWKNASDD